MAAISRKHISTLDGVRGIAILLVLGIHFMYSGAVPSAPRVFVNATKVLAFGWMGVDLFFVLSGFLITGILLDTVSSPNYFRAFYARRVLRIFPVYYAILTVVACALPCAARFPSFPWPSPTLLHLSFFYIQNWWMSFHSQNAAGVLGDYWSLAVEEQFYLLWPLVVLKLRRPGLVRFCIFVCMMTPLLRLLVVIYRPRALILLIGTIPRMDTLLWGALVAIAVRTPGVVRRLKPYLLPIAIVSALALFIIDFPLHELYTRAQYTQSVGYSVIAVGFSAFLLMGYLADGSSSPLARLLSSRLLTSFGRYSYGIYLFHAFLIAGMNLACQRTQWYGHSVPAAAVLCLLFLAASFGVAFVSYEFFERRFLQLKSRFEAVDHADLPVSSQDDHQVSAASVG